MSQRSSLPSPHYYHVSPPNCVLSEPMNLGSPPNSPSQSTSHQSSGQYLPGFLMGNTSRTQIASPSTRPHSIHFQSFEPQQTLSKAQQPNSLSRQNRTTNSRQCPTAPPTQSLWAMPTSPALKSANINGERTSNIGSSLSTGVEFTSPRPFSLTSRELPDKLIGVLTSTPGQNQDENEDENTWVTVFGYPASKATSILQQFSQFGTIEKYIITNSGNWMHIKYQNKLQVKCALSKNGRIFVDNIMLGVQPCTDMEVIRRPGLSALPPYLDNAQPAKSGAGVLGSSIRHANLVNCVTSQGDGLNQSFDTSWQPTSSDFMKANAGSNVMRHSSMRSLASGLNSSSGIVHTVPGSHGLTRVVLYLDIRF